MDAGSGGSVIDAVVWIVACAAVALAAVRGIRAIREASPARRVLVGARVAAGGLLVLLGAWTAASMLSALVGSGRAVALGPVEVARGFVVILGEPTGQGLLMTELPEQVNQAYGQAIGLDVNSTLRVRLEPSFVDQLAAWGLFGLAIAAVAVPLALVRAVLARAAAGQAFTARTVRLVEALGLVVALGWLLVVAAQHLLTGHLLARAGATAGFAWPPVVPQLLIGLAILAVVRVWREALPAEADASASAASASAASASANALAGASSTASADTPAGERSPAAARTEPRPVS